MAQQTRRYTFQGPPLQALRDITDPALILTPPGFVIVFDVVWEDTICDAANMDLVMERFGCVAYGNPPTSDPPFIGIKSPNGTVWSLVVSDLGVLTLIPIP